MELYSAYLFDDIVIKLYTTNSIYHALNAALNRGIACPHVTDYENALNYYILQRSRPELFPHEARPAAIVAPLTLSGLSRDGFQQ